VGATPSRVSFIRSDVAGASVSAPGIPIRVSLNTLAEGDVASTSPVEYLVAGGAVSPADGGDVMPGCDGGALTLSCEGGVE